MVIPVICPSCRRLSCVPGKLAGRVVRCPRCSHAWRVPLPDPSAASSASAAGPSGKPLTLAAHLGIASLALGLLAILLLCLPLVGYGSLFLSSGGLALGLWGLARSVDEDGGAVCKLLGLSARRPAAATRPLLTFPLAGAGACLLALALALLPVLFG
jgi:hypothetical protein